MFLAQLVNNFLVRNNARAVRCVGLRGTNLLLCIAQLVPISMWCEPGRESRNFAVYCPTSPKQFVLGPGRESRSFSCIARRVYTESALVTNHPPIKKVRF